MALASLLQRAMRMPDAEPPKRAVIDIGSNSVRLVVWAGPARSPWVILNEKVSANLGRTLARDGMLPRKAMEVALRGLARFALLLRLLEVETVRTVATAAARDAGNGGEFLDRVRKLGLAPELLSGEEEARASAFGVASAFPGASGIVGDLGGGSLELVELHKGAPGRGDSFPWGTLRLPEMRGKQASAFAPRVRDALAKARWLGAGEGRPFYLVGGSWRALTTFAMQEAAYPLGDVHGYAMPPARAGALAETLAIAPVRQLQEVPHLPNSRIASLPDAAMLLAELVRHVRPSMLVTSGFGLREGLLFAMMDAETRAIDPLLLAIREQARRGVPTGQDGDALDRWIAPLFAEDSPTDARLRLAACLLATLVEAEGREARVQRSIELALHERWIGLDADGRAMIAAALLTEAGERTLPHQLGLLCPAPRLATAVRWGEAMRFARKLSGGVAGVLRRSAVRIVGDDLILVLEKGLETLHGDGIAQQHAVLAASLGLVPVLAADG